MKPKVQYPLLLIILFVLLSSLTINGIAEDEVPPSPEPSAERSLDNPVPLSYPTGLGESLLEQFAPSEEEGFISPRIVGGSPVSPQNAYPWIASLQYYGVHYCGGTLIAPKWVLTAAHCWTDEFGNPYVPNPVNDKAVLGEYNLSSSSGKEKKIGITEVYVHPFFDIVTFENDLALLKLNSAAPFSNYVQLIDVAHPDLGGLVGTPSVVAGWGTTSYGGSNSNVLLKADIDILADSDCSNYGVAYKSNSMLCAGKMDGSRDACQGDSGGPLFFNDGSSWQQAGIVSWGYQCGVPNFPGIYTRVSQYFDWIADVIYVLNGSAEISADQPIVAISRPHIGYPHLGSEIMAYNGVNSGAPIVYLPMLFNGKFGYTSTFTVQNTGAGTATYTIIFKDAANGSTSCTISGESLPQHGVKTYDVTDMGPCDSGTLPADWFGGATISSNEPLAVVAKPDINGTDSVTYNGFTGGATTTYLPMLFRGKYGYQSAFYVQNLDPSLNATLSIDFYDADGNFTCTYDDPVTLGPSVTRGYWMGGISNANCGVGDPGFDPAGWAGSAVVNISGGGSSEIVAIGRPHLGEEVAAYNGFTAGGQTNYLPMLFRGQWGYDSAFYIQNISGSEANISVDFYDVDGNFTCTYNDPVPLASNATRGYWTPALTCNSGGSFPVGGWAGSAEVTSTQDVIAVGRPHLSNGQVVVYNAFTGGANDVFVPMNFREWFGNETALYIQNLGGAATTATITFYDEEDGFLCQMEQMVEPGASGAIWLAALDSSVCVP